MFTVCFITKEYFDEIEITVAYVVLHAHFRR